MKRPKSAILGDRCQFKKIVICKGKLCDNAFKRSLNPDRFGKYSFQLLLPYVQGSPPKFTNIGTEKIITFHPYPTLEGSKFLSKTTHNMIRYNKIWSMSRWARPAHFDILIKHLNLKKCQEPYEHYLKYKSTSCCTSYYWSIKYTYFLYLKVGHIYCGLKIADENWDFSNSLPLHDVQQRYKFS